MKIAKHARYESPSPVPLGAPEKHHSLQNQHLADAVKIGLAGGDVAVREEAAAGDVKLSLIILTTEVSLTTVLAFCSSLVDARRIRPKNGDVFSLFSQSQIAEGILRAERLAGSDVPTSGSSSVIRSWGSGFAPFTRRNWSRCNSTSSATKALTGMIRSEQHARQADLFVLATASAEHAAADCFRELAGGKARAHSGREGGREYARGRPRAF